MGLSLICDSLADVDRDLVAERRTDRNACIGYVCMEAANWRQYVTPMGRQIEALNSI